MGVVRKKVSTEWVLIAKDVTDFSIQNIGQWPVVIGYTDQEETPPSSNYGFVIYPMGQSIKQSVADSSYVVNASYVWARTMNNSAAIIVETTDEGQTENGNMEG